MEHIIIATLFAFEFVDDTISFDFCNIPIGVKALFLKLVKGLRIFELGKQIKIPDISSWDYLLYGT
jgi:hypothetical protein